VRRFEASNPTATTTTIDIAARIVKFLVDSEIRAFLR
jgi:hypothetical protein